MDCSPPGSSVYGIFQARVLEWGAIVFSVTPTRTTVIIKQKQNKTVGNNVEKLEPLYVASGNIKWWTYCERSLVIPNTVKQTIATWPSNSILVIYPKEFKIRNQTRDLYAGGNTHCSIIHNSQKVETVQSPSTDEWINNMIYISIKWKWLLGWHPIWHQQPFKIVCI